jgi:7,8-dihydropterin-6-yl-methyl-4-(beta-D-ribofuranosyl)aminobenzene 5'-phosphate synthase
MAAAIQDGVELDELEVSVIVDNETDTLSSVQEGVPQVPELAQLAARTAPVSCCGHECQLLFDRLCGACHGLSLLLTGRHKGVQHRMLFDAGPDGELWLANARRLAVDLSTIELVVLSHWHFDHSGALPKALTAICAARSAADLEPPIVDVHPGRPDQRGILTPSGKMWVLPLEPTLQQLRDTSARFESHNTAHSVCDGFFFVSGVIERQTDYETGLAGHHSLLDEAWKPDPLIMDERFVAARVRGRGVSVLSACSHAGIVNTCLAAGRQFPGVTMDTVFGGFHLAGKSVESRIEPTIRDLELRIKPRLLAPGHCTGWRAKARFANVFGARGCYAPSVVGSLYTLRGST